MTSEEPEKTNTQPQQPQQQQSVHVAAHPATRRSIKIMGMVLTIALISSIALNFYIITVSRSIITGNVAMLPSSDGSKFSFLDPAIAVMNINDYMRTKNEYIASYAPLKSEINQTLSEANGTFGVYFEDLQFHSWFGINERDQFKPASMLKATTVAAILKEVEEGELSLDKEVTLNQDDINMGFGTLYKNVGDTLTIKQLIEIALQQSDNTAIKKLHEYMSEERWTEARLMMGLPEASVDQSAAGTALSPKQFSTVFRTLYYSGYLSRSFSNWMLMLMSQTEFNQGIPAGVPKDVVVSHKIGVWEAEGSVHDCGIVYAKKPYILCIMSEDTTYEEGNRVIKEISREVYNYISKS